MNEVEAIVQGIFPQASLVVSATNSVGLTSLNWKFRPHSWPHRSDVVQQACEFHASVCQN